MSPLRLPCLLALTARCVKEKGAEEVGAVAKKLIEGAIYQDGRAPQRAALAFCLAQLAMDPQTSTAAAAAASAEPSLSPM